MLEPRQKPKYSGLRIATVKHGCTAKPQTLRAKLHEWGIAPSYSRPGVSDDNAFVESFFRTLKYCPKWPVNGFACIEEEPDCEYADL